MYQSESVPKNIRGATVSSYQLLITLGIWTAYMVKSLLRLSCNHADQATFPTKFWSSDALVHQYLSIHLQFAGQLGH
jgi:hypothetical protein